ncbi:Boophilin-H2 [Armadillidium nasatum]|uniref:Boophilin-H2 n=1 Tax=Armadillidium nasatum TaxID=96803 RepID=A0A5N5SVK2_9CRUS|nr:Boophilin-H2 [Armadillidium nasatum]
MENMVDICNRPKVVGNCNAAFPRYFYNNATGQCEKFTYGGCGGNGNNFKLLSDCEDKCEVYNAILFSLFTAGCDKPVDQGFGGGSLERYFYNETSLECETFTYRGFEGNGNNYLTKAECEAECKT